ncbi:MAG: hypothetical protein ACYDBZ_10640 [Steroidobacteraceae bacterium]
MRYLSVVSDYFHQIHFAEIKSSLRIRIIKNAAINVNFTGEAGISLQLIRRNDGASCGTVAGRCAQSSEKKRNTVASIKKKQQLVHERCRVSARCADEGVSAHRCRTGVRGILFDHA